MEVQVSQKQQCCIIRLSGKPADLLPGPIPEVIASIKRGGREIIINLAGLDYINPLLVKAINESNLIAKSHCSQIAVAEPKPAVLRLLKLNGVSNDIPIYTSENEAIRQIGYIEYAFSDTTDKRDKLLICQECWLIARDLRRIFYDHPSKPLYKIVTTRSLSEGKGVISKMDVDCIIIDFNFKLMRISEFIEEMKIDRKSYNIPIIIVSSEKHFDEAELMIRHGANDLIRYPFNKHEVTVRIQNLITDYRDKAYYESGKGKLS